MALSQRAINERAAQIMKEEKLSAEEAYAKAVLQLSMEELEKEKRAADREKEMDQIISQGKRVIGDLKSVHEKLEKEIMDDTNEQNKRSTETA